MSQNLILASKNPETIFYNLTIRTVMKNFIESRTDIKSILSKIMHEPKTTPADDYIRANEILNFLKTHLCFNFEGITGEDFSNASIADISALLERNIEYFKKYKFDKNGIVTKEESNLIA